MKKIDHEGLLLAKYQAELFEYSYTLKCSSSIFMRRFIYSKLLTEMDKNKTVGLSLDVKEGMEDIMNQFGDSDYGKEKFSPNSLYWMGYMYRYISYTRGVSTRFVMKLFDYRFMDRLYPTFHTQGPNWCIESMLELKGLTEDVFDGNYRLKEIIKAKGRY